MFGESTKGCCQVCFQLIDAEVKICSECSAVYCQPCINRLVRWECPTCKVYQRNCDFKRCRPVEEQITKLKLKQHLKCETHSINKIYFCLAESCQTPLCPDCYIEEHLGHPKTPFKAIYDAKKREVVSAMDTFDQKFSQLKFCQSKMQEKIRIAKELPLS